MIVTIILEIAGVTYVCRAFKDESIQIDRIIDSLEGLDDQGTVTRQGYRLPLFGDLLEALGDITDPSIDAKVNLNNAIKGRIFIEGFERFKGSFFVINSIASETSKQIQVIFEGNETDLKASLSNITMSELFAGETLLYNYTEMVQYFDAPDTYRDANGYIFPLVNYGQGFTFTSVFDGLGETSFKAATTFKKCFDLMPFDITTVGIDDLMNQAILLHNDKNQTPKVNTTPLANTGSLFRGSSYVDTSQDSFLIPFDAVFNYQNIVFDTTDNVYTANTDGAHTFALNMRIGIKRTGSAPNNSIFQFFLFVKRAGVVVTSVPLVWSQVSTSSGFQEFFVRTDQTTVDLLSGDVVQLNLDSRADETTVGTTSSFSCIQAPAFLATSTIDIPANCPKITAWEILSTIVLQCKGRIETNQDGSYTITPWTDWIESNSTQIILDNIVEKDIDVQVKPFSVNGAKSIRLGYKENEDFYSKQFLELTNEPFGQKLIENTGTEYAKNEIEIKLPMSSIPHASIPFTNAPIPQLIDRDNKTIVGNAVILQTANGVSNLSWTLKSIFSSSTKQYSTIPFTGNWGSVVGGFNETDSGFGQSLSFFSSQNYPNNNLYERYWKKYLTETYGEASREINISLKLNVNDVDGWNFNEKFYYKNTLLRLISLKGISLTSKDNYVSATFMKRFTVFKIDIAPFWPYDVLDSIVQWKSSLDNANLGDGSAADQTDLLNSANAYGFFYDSVKDVATQNGQILIT